MGILSKIQTYCRLGINNLFWVADYRIKLKKNHFVSTMPISVAKVDSNAVFFSLNKKNSAAKSNITQPTLKAFGWLNIHTNALPNWVQSLTNDKVVNNNACHWSILDDFSLEVGDVKSVWELSRFDWLLNFSLGHLSNNNSLFIDKINLWLNSWCEVNPVNQGVNWKCGQEASIRVLHLALACYLLKQHKSISPALGQLIFNHLQRIAPTIRYAMAQNNNHGTSEAAALFIGASLLINNSTWQSNESHKKTLNKWSNQGRFWLENRSKVLINSDGCFSQNSVNYHRLMLDTLSLAEFFRNVFSEPLFSKPFYKKASLASLWLHAFVDPCTGDAPNMGHNDGANLLPLTLCDYRDFRPSVQFAYSLFQGCYPYPITGEYQQICTLLPVSVCQYQPQKELHTINTGFQLLKNSDSRVYIRTPNVKFRPGCCDALSVDFWLGSLNILKGTGSYSYNCPPNFQEYFPSVKAHNTVAFDQCEQMPKLSRFLYNNWLKTHTNKIAQNVLTTSYINNAKHKHIRKITLLTNSIEIEDQLSGFHKEIDLHWHLASLNWQQQGMHWRADNITIEIESPNPLKAELVEGLESRYYLQNSKIPVLKVTMKTSGLLKTTIRWVS